MAEGQFWLLSVELDSCCTFEAESGSALGAVIFILGASDITGIDDVWATNADDDDLEEIELPCCT